MAEERKKKISRKRDKEWIYSYTRLDRNGKILKLEDVKTDMSEQSGRVRDR